MPPAPMPMPPVTPQRIPLPTDALCSSCRREVTLNPVECADGVFDCPYCKRRVAAFLPAELRCPACKNRLVLSSEERSSGAFTCNRCRGAFVTRPPEAAALVPQGSAQQLAEHEAHTKRLLTISTALGWGGLGLALVGGAVVGSVAGAAAVFPIGLGIAAAFGGAIVGQIARAGQRRLM